VPPPTNVYDALAQELGFRDLTAREHVSSDKVVLQFEQLVREPTIVEVTTKGGPV